MLSISLPQAATGRVNAHEAPCAVDCQPSRVRDLLAREEWPGFT